MKTILIPVIFLVGFPWNILYCQVGINIDGSNPDKSAMLDVSSDSKGLLLPRLSTVQIMNIWKPAAGLIVFNTDSADFYGFAGAVWKGFYNPEDSIFRMCDDSLFYSGQWYTTVQIGNQCWLAENLNVGTQIMAPATPGSGSTIEKYCYNNSSDSCAIYGGLYTYYEAAAWSTSPGVQGICPDGWHIPVAAEWNVLSGFLGGDDLAGGPLKETGFRHWIEPNYGATNETGFTALGGGTYDPIYGNGFYLTRDLGSFWTSTWDGWAWRRDISRWDDNLGPYRCQPEHSFSVRCLKN